MSLQYMDNLNDDEFIVYSAVENCVESFNYASDRLKNNK